jgi:DNA-binding GntR family transcriptional regulator
MVSIAKRYDVSRTTISKIIHQLLDQEREGAGRK